MLRAIFSLSVSFALVACGTDTSTYAYRPGTTNHQKQVDWSQCEAQAFGMAPPNMQTGITPAYTTPTYTTPTRTSCNSFGAGGYGSMNCTTTGGQLSGGTTYGGVPYNYDANAEQRWSFEKGCMLQKGYVLSEQPDCTDRQTPAGLTANPYDQIIPAQGEVCIATVGPKLGVPLRVK